MSLQHEKCPVSVTDINSARIIFGPNVSGLRGRTTRDNAIVRVKEQRVAIPGDFYKMHKMVTLTADVMFVSGIPFFGDILKKYQVPDSRMRAATDCKITG